MGTLDKTAADAVAVDRHRLYEDLLAILTGALVVSLGVVIYSKAVLLTGSTAGLALLLQYATGSSFWLMFSLVNLPFYLLAIKRLGWLFALRTFVAVSLVSLFTRLTAGWVEFARLDPVYATIAGGALMGMGLLILFRHRTGLGGINILAIYLQERCGIRAGYFQLGVDLAILTAAAFVLPPANLALSIVGATVVNLMLAINHKPGRYVGVT
ncbi:membrane protein [Sinorhizobium sojae CCBAU 05684]|uniref:Membrane protein n=1 Tax=Sinorhizobium sojae CCBAU 05684 TaxID=716928 RepID=A0A249PGF1_9HYPH|nr:YitT family protein [Sinorhizobium sojae]ASY65043.1 membrane protein [Sinorhizobium sojae CCBAU 05684]